MNYQSVRRPRVRTYIKKIVFDTAKLFLSTNNNNIIDNKKIKTDRKYGFYFIGMKIKTYFYNRSIVVAT